MPNKSMNVKTLQQRVKKSVCLLCVRGNKKKRDGEGEEERQKDLEQRAKKHRIKNGWVKSNFEKEKKRPKKC